MKKIKLSKWATIVVLLLISGSIISCGPGEKELLIGTWQGSDFTFEQSEGPDLAAMIEGGKDLHLNGKLIIEETGTYIITSPDDMMNGKGTWELKDGMLVLLDDNENEVLNTIEEISEDLLVTSNEVAMETPLGNIAGKIMLTYEKR